MSSNVKTNPPRSFWIISGLALVWNLFGVMAYLMEVTMSDEAHAALPAAERALYENIPAWATGAFAISVFAGALGCLALLLRKRWAMPLFVLSLLGILVHDAHSFLLSDALQVYGAGAAVLPAVVIAIAAGLIWYANSARSRGWLT